MNPGPEPSPADDRAAAHDDELAELADLHGTLIDECVRVGLLVLGDQDAAERAAVEAFVVAHRRWYADDDHVASVRRALTRALERADRVPRDRPDGPLLAAFAAVPLDARLAAAHACAAGLSGEALGAALGLDPGEAEARRANGEDAVAASLSPGTDVAARCTALPGPTDADATLLAVLQGVTDQVHVRDQPRWVLAAVAVGVVLIVLAIVLSIDWSGGDEGPATISGTIPTDPDGTTPPG